MKTRFFAVLIIMALAAALPSTAAAQLNQTGTLAGTVTDSDKLPLPGATVTIKSPVIIVPQMDAITGPKGNYRFLSLPPGLYEVAFSLDGMDTLVRKDIRISVAQTTTIDAVLEPSTLSETVVVVGESPTIDVKSTTKATNLDRTFIAALPTARNLDAYFNMAPGVTAERNPNGLMSSASGSGEIQFGAGAICDARFGDRSGADAVYALLALREGEFALDPSFLPLRNVINLPSESLLLEGMRRLAEAAR